MGVTAVYQRASDIKQDIDGISLETQDDIITKFCDYKGYDNVKLYTEIRSARSIKGRKQLQQLMADIESGYIKRVIVYRLDRLTRSLRDLMNLLHLFENHNVELHSTYENIDTSSPSGRMLVQVLGIIAEWESSNTSMLVSNSMQFKASQGIWQSNAPYGFDLKEGKLIINEEESNMLKQAFDLILSGYTAMRATNEMNEKYSLDWGKSFLIRKIRSAAIAGNIKRNGKVYKDTHEAIVDDKTQKHLINLVTNQSSRTKSKDDDLFRQRLKCPACDNFLSLGQYKTKKKLMYRYSCDKCFREGRKTISINEGILEEEFLKYMKRFKIEIGKDDIKESKEDKSLNKRLIDISRQRDRIQRAWIQSLINDDDLAKYQEELTKEENEIRAKLEDREHTPINEIEDIRETLNKYFEYMPRIEKREFIQRFIKEIHFERKLIKGYQRKYDVKVTSVVFI